MGKIFKKKRTLHKTKSKRTQTLLTCRYKVLCLTPHQKDIWPWNYVPMVHLGRQKCLSWQDCDAHLPHHGDNYQYHLISPEVWSQQCLQVCHEAVGTWTQVIINLCLGDGSISRLTVVLFTGKPNMSIIPPDVLLEDSDEKLPVFSYKHYQLVPQMGVGVLSRGVNTAP